MKFALALATAGGAGAVAHPTCYVCHSIAKNATPPVTDEWCMGNCNHQPQPNCPSAKCICDDLVAPPAPEYLGYYSYTWDAGSVGPKGANLGVAFSGWVDPQQAIAYTGPPLQGTKYVSVGGGNGNGHFSAARLETIASSINIFTGAGFEGLCFDVEECDAGLAEHFEKAIAAAKAGGMKVFVTVSHSAPYGCPDGAKLVASFLQNENLEFVSPQLYTAGTEPCADFTANDQLDWSGWAVPAKTRIVPSIVDVYQYPQAYGYFKHYWNVTLAGYMQWTEDGSGKCHSISPVVTDQWCNQNCPANCPSNMCTCNGSFVV